MIFLNLKRLHLSCLHMYTSRFMCIQAILSRCLHLVSCFHVHACLHLNRFILSCLHVCLHLDRIICIHIVKCLVASANWYCCEVTIWILIMFQDSKRALTKENPPNKFRKSPNKIDAPIYKNNMALASACIVFLFATLWDRSSAIGREKKHARYTRVDPKDDNLLRMFKEVVLCTKCSDDVRTTSC